MFPHPAEGSWGLAESAARRRTRAEKEKQRKEVVCSELCAEIISVCVSCPGLDAAVGAWATFPGRGEVPCECGCGSWPCSTGSSGVIKHCSWRAHPTCGSALPTPLRPGAVQGSSAGGCTHHCGLPGLQWVLCTPQLGHCPGYQCVSLLCEPGDPGQGWGSQHPFYQLGAAGTAFLGTPWVLRLRSAPLSSRGEPRAALLTAGCGVLTPRDKIM